MKYTEAPWLWRLNLKSKHVELCGGRHRGNRYQFTVMDFVRWGMRGAAPRLNSEARSNFNTMERIEKFAKVVAGREHHADWFQTVDHPDMRLIQSSPELIGVCERLDEFQRAYDKNTCQEGCMPGNDLYSGKLMEIVQEARRLIAFVEGDTNGHEQA